jgi:hypothetical protein
MAAIYSNGGNRWNILGFNFTKRDALSSVYKISMVGMQLPEEYKKNFDASREEPSLYIFQVVALDRYSKGRGFDPHHGQANFSACSV